MIQWFAENPAIAGTFLTVVGGVLGALFSNWDKIFRPGRTFTDQAAYESSGDFATEMRILLENLGWRENLARTQALLLDANRESILRNNTSDPTEVDAILAVVKQELPTADDIIEALLPVWGRHYRLEEVEKVNKLHTTKTMREFNRKTPRILEDLAPIVQEMNIKTERRILDTVERLQDARRTDQPSPSEALK